jgi:3',5'-cyclic AMP phosphodiesterase CpdA
VTTRGTVRRRRSLAALGAAICSAALAVGLAGPSASGAELVERSTASAPAAAAIQPAVTYPTARLLVVGDIARSGGAQSRTAAVIKARSPWRVMTLGDNAYNSGSSSEFAKYYAPSYGQFKPITWPLPGNHEYNTSGAAGYRKYFGITGTTWWWHRAGAWIVIGLDSERVGSSAQLTFLKDVLARNNGKPTIVAWHRPRYSLGEHGDQRDTDRLWSAIKNDRDVRIVLWGHDHDYERMAVPIAGRTSRIQAFVVGTGGAELRPMRSKGSRTWSWKRVTRTYGVLELQLRQTSWTWAFRRTDGTIADSGTSRV